ncbi:uncharacterized protein LOC119462680 [Dermacentor silvarum]|uniref:uncharacterized protein LOC119462680 n=1 Tax=Dermacentor silvarum TaxID=543639 RepID=UPI002101CC58|nr:uncharacterized protein LOC119462680 [Dermacentor silvarum]
MGIVLTLCGLTVASHYDLTDFTKAAIIVVQGLAVSLHVFEMLMMSQDIGERGTDRRSPEPAPAAATASTLKDSPSRMTQLVYNQSDLIMLITLVLESLGFIIVSQKVVSKAYILLIQWSFALLVACRTIKTLQKRLPQVLLELVWDLIDNMRTKKIFSAYDIGWAFISAEDETIAKTNTFCKNTELANNIRDSCRRNKLQMLLKMMDIQHKCPDVKVATTASKVVRRALRKAYDDLGDLHECLKIDDMQFQALKQELVRMLQSEDRMPTNFIVGHTVHCVLLSITWLPWEEVINIHKVYGTANRARDHEGRLQNADTNEYFFGQGPFVDYLLPTECIGMIGFLTDQPSVCEAVCETDVDVVKLPMTVLEEMNEQNPDPPTVIYRMWFTVAVRIALGVLIKHKGYQVPAIERHSHVRRRRHNLDLELTSNKLQETLRYAQATAGLMFAPWLRSTGTHSRQTSNFFLCLHSDTRVLS